MDNKLAIIILAALIAMLYSAAYGFTIEKIAYKPLRGSQRLSALISAIGMSLFLQNYVLLAQTSNFLPYPNLVPTWDFLKPYEHIVRSTEIVIYIATALVMVLLTYLIKFTRMGKAMRAVAQDMDGARIVGININKIFGYAFALATVVTGFSGVLLGTKYYMPPHIG